MTVVDPFAGAISGRVVAHQGALVDPLKQLQGRPGRFELPYMRGDDPRLIRKNHGRPRVMLPDGSKVREYARVTSWIDCLEDKYNLQRYWQRLVMLGLLERETLLVKVAACRNDKHALNLLADELREIGRESEKSSLGTSMHDLFEQVEAGETPKVPAAYRKDLDEYRRKVEPFEMVYTEPFMVHDPLRMGGTPDRLARWRGRGPLIVFDNKTGTSLLEYGLLKAEMQLATYADSVLYDCRGPEPIRTDIEIDQTRGWLMHMPPGSGEAQLIPVDLVNGRRSLKLAQTVHQHRKQKPDQRGVTHEQIDAYYAAGSDPILELIVHTNDRDVIRRLWRDNVRKGTFLPHHAAAAQQRAAELANRAQLETSATRPSGAASSEGKGTA